MATTAKVKLVSKTLTGTGEYAQCVLQFAADYADGRNQEWAAATPVLTVNMHVKDALGQKFNLGGSYTLTLEED